MLGEIAGVGAHHSKSKLGLCPLQLAFIAVIG